MFKNTCRLAALAILLSAGAGAQVPAPAVSDIPRSQRQPWCTAGCSDAWHIRAVNCPSGLPAAGAHSVVIAVIDDGFNTAHPAVTPFLYDNSSERLANGKDDDGNGYADDRCGWDVSDLDNDVRFPDGRGDFFYHGTYLTGIITGLLRTAYGGRAPELFRIIPVKALADGADRGVMTDGYRGMAYAARTGAQVVCCAWSGGTPGDDDRAAMTAVLREDRTVIASAGNEYSGRGIYPARTAGIISVSAVDRRMGKPVFANYHTTVDVCAPGTDICGPAAAGDSSRLTCRGTSGAAAIVTAAAAILKSRYPEVSRDGLLRALKNTARPVDARNTRLAGRLGAGVIDIGAALAYLENRETMVTPAAVPRPEGSLVYHRSAGPGKREWRINPAGAYRGFRFNMNEMSLARGEGKFFFYPETSTIPAVTAQLRDMPADLYVPGDSVRVVFTPGKKCKGLAWEMSFAADIIDSGVLYCSGIKRHSEEEGTITDGSGDAPYANYASCTWLLTAPEGKRYTLLFSEFDTQPNVDFVYVFNGERAVPRQMLAKFSGSNRPPRIISPGSTVLVWFVTDGDTTGAGWTLNYRAR